MSSENTPRSRSHSPYREIPLPLSEAESGSPPENESESESESDSLPENEESVENESEPESESLPENDPQPEEDLPWYTHRPRTPRTVILCFDGTGKKFGENVSNVVRFFRALKEDDNQIVYYQPGLGTYKMQSFTSSILSGLWSGIDHATAWDLDNHVKEGYRFLVENYWSGDKICLFGFSRGAYTARILAGMIYKVGILKRQNMPHVDFAFSVYCTTGYEGYLLSQEFRPIFSHCSPEGSELPIVVDFLGCWDTVASVGMVPRTLPYASINYGVKAFRHALALDERRIRFRPSLWYEMTPEREEELDLHIHEYIPIEAPLRQSSRIDPKAIDIFDLTNLFQIFARLSNVTADRDHWRYKPVVRKYADVKEVWFAGCHSDVGGGSHSHHRGHSLSFISLRWMIKECLLSDIPMNFRVSHLVEMNFDLSIFNKLKRREWDLETRRAVRNHTDRQTWIAGRREANEWDPRIILSEIQTKLDKKNDEHKQTGREAHSEKIKGNAYVYQKKMKEKEEIQDEITLLEDTKKQILEFAFSDNVDQELGKEGNEEKAQLGDICDQIFDQLVLIVTASLGGWIFWWILECFPMIYVYQDEEGNWVRHRNFNLGRGRLIPSHDDVICVHKSVETRIEETRETQEPYTPRARNWHSIMRKVKYVD